MEYKEKEDITYPSAGLLLESVMDEYDKERQRTEHLERKAEHFMTLIALISTIFIPIIGFDNIINTIKEGQCITRCITIIASLFIATAFIILIYAFKKLYDAYKLRTYYRFNMDNIVYDNFKRNHNEVEYMLCDNYRDIVNDNIKENNDKCNCIEIGIKFSGIGFLILALSTIVLKLIV